MWRYSHRFASVKSLSKSGPRKVIHSRIKSFNFRFFELFSYFKTEICRWQIGQIMVYPSGVATLLSLSKLFVKRLKSELTFTRFFITSFLALIYQFCCTVRQAWVEPEQLLPLTASGRHYQEKNCREILQLNHWSNILDNQGPKWFR